MLFISISFLFDLVCNKRRKGMMSFCCCFVDVRILIFYVLFCSFLLSCLYRDRSFFCAGGKCVCFISISFLFGLVCNKRREGYNVILLLVCCRPNISCLCSILFFFFSCLYGDRSFFCADCKCVCVFSIFFFVRSCL